MTRQPSDDDIHPRGHLVRAGSTLHQHRTKRTHSDEKPPRSRHRIRGPAHDVDVAVAKTRRGHGKSHKNKRKR
jgi:hypothetical protein